MGFWTQSSPRNNVAAELAPAVVSAANKIRRHQYVLPPFQRVAWTDSTSKAVHAPRLARIRRAWAIIELASARRTRPCALHVEPAETFGKRVAEIADDGGSWRALRVEETSSSTEPVPKLIVQLVSGSRRDVERFRKAWIAKDDESMGALLGYPACCRAFFIEVFNRRRFHNPTWLAGVNTPEAEIQGFDVVVSGPPAANVLLRALGVRAAPHLPCSFQCPGSVALGEALLHLGRELGFREEMEWLSQALDWSVDWSARHGVLEIRAPVLKLAVPTDATADTLCLRRHGETVPEGAAHGLRFPYTRASAMADRGVLPPPRVT